MHVRNLLCPRPIVLVGGLMLSTALVFGSVGCSSVSKLRAQQAQLNDRVEQMRTRAYRCKPEELALAESHIDFAQWELSQGNYSRAKDHLTYAAPLVDEADTGSRATFCLGDRDADGLADVEDQCPDQPENFNGYEDEDGCPERDRDGDTYIDALDQCPDQPEDFDGEDDEDGCPDVVNDKDGDGILDGDDLCPLIPEDLDQFEDEDGCPDPDNDRDRVCDLFVSERGMEADYQALCAGQDQCPNDPEDMDGWADEDGCPDPDNDDDKILDVDDQCPNEPELYNGREDEDGCPEVSLGDGRINITEEVYFATNKTEVLSRSYGLLDDIAQLLKDNPTVEVRVEGHTDDQGRADYNLRLSQGRADSVKNELIQRGITAGRLDAVGYGEDRPSVDIDGLRGDDLRDARARNRRVEFIVTSQ